LPEAAAATATAAAATADDDGGLVLVMMVMMLFVGRRLPVHGRLYSGPNDQTGHRLRVVMLLRLLLVVVIDRGR